MTTEKYLKGSPCVWLLIDAGSVTTAAKLSSVGEPRSQQLMQGDLHFTHTTCKITHTEFLV